MILRKVTSGTVKAWPGASAVSAAADGIVAAITKDTNQVPILVVRHPDNVLTVSLQLPMARHESPQSTRNFLDESIEALRQIPGVEAATVASVPPTREPNIRIGMAVSDDMLHWRRYGTEPVIDNGEGISGDPQVVR